MTTETLGKLKATCFKMTLTKCNNVWLFVSVHSAVQMLSISIKKKNGKREAAYALLSA